MKSNSLLRFLRLVGSLLRAIYWEPVTQAFIDLQDMTWGTRILTVAGYGFVFFLLLMTLLFELAGPRLAVVSFDDPSAPVQHTIPILVMAVGSLGMIVGWAYLLAGAGAAKRRVFLPVLAVFLFQLFLLSASALGGLENGELRPSATDLPHTILCLATPFPVLIAGGLHLFTSKRFAFWRNLTWLSFLLWLGVGLFFVGGMWLVTPDLPTTAGNLNGYFTIMLLVAVPWWLSMGLSVVRAALQFGSQGAALVRGLLPGSLFRALVLFIVLVHPAIMMPVIGFNQTTTLGMTVVFDSLLVSLLIPAMIILMIARRWNNRTAGILLALSIAVPLFVLGVFMALNETDILDVLGTSVESSLGYLAPLMVYMLLMAYTLLSYGSEYANQDGETVPREGRVLIVFGLSLLVISFTIFFVNLRIPQTGQLDPDFRNGMNSLYAVGVFFLGFPYLLWTLLRNRGKLGGETTEPALQAVEQTYVARRWVILSTVLAVMVVCVLCLVGMITIAPPPPELFGGQ